MKEALQQLYLLEAVSSVLRKFQHVYAETYNAFPTLLI